MRRLLTLVLVAGTTATATLWWLHDGDLAEAIDPVMAEWDAELLARDAGLDDLVAPTPQTTDPPAVVDEAESD